jgi:hypothetical protein
MGARAVTQGARARRGFSTLCFFFVLLFIPKEKLLRELKVGGKKRK